jgi:hypothetical protein
VPYKRGQGVSPAYRKEIMEEKTEKLIKKSGQDHKESWGEMDTIDDFVSKVLSRSWLTKRQQAGKKEKFEGPAAADPVV